MNGPTDDDAVPVSVRLGEVVPPEDPEDWTRPLTWVAALGMLAAPIVAFTWFAVSPPLDGDRAVPGTYAVAVSLAAGAAATGATQQGIARAWTATLAAGLFGALVVIVFGAAMAGERQVGAASPTLAHGVASALAGLGGAAAAAVVGGLLARRVPRAVRFGPAVLLGAAVAVLAVARLLPT
jgi:hypothetical protein